RPKVMLSIGNKPILQYVLEALAANGVRRVILVVGYRKEQVQDYFGSGEALGLDIRYVEQRRQLGTAHALMQARELASDVFLVISGDNIVNASTVAPLTSLTSHAILVRAQEDISKYGVVTVRRGLVSRIVEKPGGDGSNLVNTGVYVFTKKVFDLIGEDVDLPPVLTRMVNEGIPVKVCETDDMWLDAVYPWDLLRLNALVLSSLSSKTGGHVEHGASIKGPVEIGEGSIIRSGSYLVGPVVIGKNCEVGPHACVFPSTSIGDNVVLSAFCCLKNSVVGNNVQVGPSSCMEDSVLTGGSRLSGHFQAHSGETMVYIEGEQHRVTMGAVVGELCQFDAGVVVNPGVMVGNRCRVAGLKLLRQNIPDGGMVV
ncbi:MAG: bifunctional sugar-1-phosphate nucleotidylyltransferase/acetyltransferase, partial [Chloroflexota bacterium]